MNLFVNDKRISILKEEAFEQLELSRFDQVLDGSSFKEFTSQVLNDYKEVALNLASVEHFLSLYTLFRESNVSAHAITLIPKDYDSFVKQVKSRFIVLKAAGGIVRKGDKVLMIYRLGKWDLPKGKIEKGEKPKVGALREVEEECNIKVALDRKLTTTWHTYTQNGKNILKKTKWYILKCVDDSDLRPQLEEDITEVRWMTPDEVSDALYNSYASIRDVFRKFYTN